MLSKSCRNLLCALTVALLAGTAAAQTAPLVTHMVSAEGLINGQPVIIETLIAAPAASTAETLNALATAAAIKDGVELSDNFTTLYGVYPQFFDKTRSNDSVTLYYNPSADPVPGALPAFRAALDAWSSVKGSTFRYAFGGLTSRTPTVGDGFNDVAFVRRTGNCNSGCVLGTTFTLYDLRRGAILEADISLYVYSGIPSMWSTDPSVPNTVDIGTVLRHELGHFAGLGHDTDPATLMYFSLDFNQVKQLGASESSALVFLYHPQPSSLASTSAPSDKHNFNLLAALDSAAPEGGIYADHFELGPNGVTKNGDVVFAADVNTAGSLGGESLFLASKAGVSTRLLSPGQTVSGVLLGDHTISYAAINDVGDVAVAWTAYPGDYVNPYGRNAAVLRKSAGGAFQAVMVPGVTPAPGGGFIYGALDSIGLSQSGDVAFLGLVQNSSAVPQAGVFVAQANGSITSVARPGDAAPGGGVLRNALWVSMASQGGYIAFLGRVIGGAGATGATGTRGRGIFLSDPKSGQLVRIAAIGDPAIGGGRILDLSGALVNAKGDVLFAAKTGTLHGSLPRRDLYLYSAGALKTIVRYGALPHQKCYSC